MLRADSVQMESHLYHSCHLDIFNSDKFAYLKALIKPTLTLLHQFVIIHPQKIASILMMYFILNIFAPVIVIEIMSVSFVILLCRKLRHIDTTIYCKEDMNRMKWLCNHQYPQLLHMFKHHNLQMHQMKIIHRDKHTPKRHKPLELLP